MTEIEEIVIVNAHAYNATYDRSRGYWGFDDSGRNIIFCQNDEGGHIAEHHKWNMQSIAETLNDAGIFDGVGLP